ncbi:D-glycerate dehydrogenase [Paracoccus sp. PS-1]|uniref:2-hydroxyacid dehydrogenase n=1 Tax=unclassified Paracoccus (in: a-proteobacteria) TaxID=2688777 RepID=UPI00048D8D11|nr:MULTISPECIES: D-glycerate dehydrogenase [unclassified Paracoccus (in: a-proteobacteria)]MDQ7262028.1 D-glycerate dehydrogenase [Paracoccus sp. PS1]
MAQPKVLLTRRWPEAIEARLGEVFDLTVSRDDLPLDADQLKAALRDYDAVLPTVTDRLSAPIFDVASPRTKILGNFGVGFSHIDLAAASARGITVTNTPDVLSECTADLAMTLLLMVARRAGEGERELRAGKWTGWRPTHMIGKKVSGATLGVVGFGRIGQAMARRAHFGFGMKIVVQNIPAVAPEILAEFGAEQVGTIDELLPRCDFVSLHCPGGAENHHLIDASRLGLMKPDGCLINTARGEVIDQHALAQALWFGTIGGAGLDVFEGEPDIPYALLGADNLVMLPHLGSATRETRDAMGLRVMENLVAFFEGREPRDRVN